MKKLLMFFFAFLLLIFARDLAGAGERGGWGREGKGRGKGERRGAEMVETLRIWKMVDSLDLSEEQLIKLLPKLKEEKELRKEYGKARREALEGLGELLEEDEEEVSEKEIKAQLKELEGIDSEFQGKTRALKDQIKKLLSVRQQAQFYIASQEFQKELRHMLGEMKRMRGPGEGRPQRGEERRRRRQEKPDDD